ncbi:ABC transporter ATP-binding protein [Segnochrobactrum spirostomi]|uniref:ABC transporter ATP-binding protein n=1 Tax=Segnochrobactrum spirostomi TaxID=2608987 RepID=A0A6A7Y4R3_9HYPH|nr:ABC transporter ATP-binding protein [Segnochrobactrum spirostomi]MQT14143.1 ABC transporter ATP-binding protein [Segnochrobactrum spirostomi]
MTDPTPLARRADATPFIRLAGISKAYGRGSEKIPIFSDLSLEIPRGDFVAIMGPSGSGKSTLLNILAGLDAVDAGRVLIDGSDLSAMRDGARARWRTETLGIVFQFYNLMPMLNAAENVELPLLLRPLSKRERRARVETVLGLVGLGDRARHYPRQMSGGQQQRVGIARAIVTDPTLILCDEPTGDLDRRAADEALDMLGRLNSEFGKTIVMVTHDPAAARAARRVLHLDKGVFSPAGREAA